MKPLVNSVAKILLFLFFICGSQNCFAENEFIRCLELARKNLAEPDKFSFLTKIPESDLQLIVDPILNRSYPSWDVYRERPFNEIWKRYTDVIGAIGELYLNQVCRERVTASPGTQFITGAEYSAKNPDGMHPDGLIVRKTEGGIIVERAAEAKMGRSQYDYGQTYGYMRVWQIHGLTLPSGEHIKPEQISLRIAEKSVPITSIDLKQSAPLVEKSIILVTTKPDLNFLGETVKTPFSGSDLHPFAQRYVAYAWLGSRATQERVEQVIAQAPKSAAAPKITVRELREPWIGRTNPPKSSIAISEEILHPPEKVWATLPPELGGPERVLSLDRSEADDRLLKRYLEKNEAFPKEGHLFDYMNRHGGPMFAFTELIYHSTRKAIARNNQLPSKESFLEWFASEAAFKRESELPRIVDLFLKNYGEAENLDFFQGLVALSPAWKNVFKQNPKLEKHIHKCSGPDCGCHWHNTLKGI